MAKAPKLPSTIRDDDLRLVLRGVRWKTYEALLRDLESHALRLSYDRGDLELMSPSLRHDRAKHRFGRLVERMTEELKIPLAGGGSTTFRRKLKKRGLEPDECYWIEHEPQVRGYLDENYDLERYPPPDLAIEIETSRSILNKLSLYAALEFPEVWRFDGEVIRVAVLQVDGTYLSGDQSLSFPWLPLTELVRFHDLANLGDETTWIRSFRDWVRDELAPIRDAWMP